MDSQAYDDIIRHLVQIAAHQETINEDLRAFNHQQVEINAAVKMTLARLETINDDLRAFNRQQVEINAAVKTTLARIETLLTRMLHPGGNGRDA